MGTTLLELQDLIVRADGHLILELPQLSVERGEVLVLFGPNGAGKSTLLQVMAGLRKPSRGWCVFKDFPRLSGLQYRRKVSTVFQSPLLLTDSVQANVASGLKFRGIRGRELLDRTQKWMERLQISPLEKRRAAVLSGGEAQRVSLARAFCLETELLLLDEPFSALDRLTRQELVHDLRDIIVRTGQTCVYVTHDLEEALAVGDRVAVFFGGRLHQVDTLQNVFSRPSTAETAAFMGVETIISGIVVSHTEDLVGIQAAGCRIEAIGEVGVGTPVYVCLRPEDITLIPGHQLVESSSARNRLSCRITRLTHQGALVRVHLDAGFNLTALVTRTSANEMQLKVGQGVIAVFKTSAIHLISARR
ncbi:MAG: ABC transporter ATP-binding protein [Chloroflexi bacterium]|nr:ABC transporter ATP-binding protein [Chloroflexota bacterium]